MSSVRERWQRTLASSSHVCGSMQASTRLVLPNKRSKLTAPALGKKCVCALTGAVLVLNYGGADRGRRRSLSAVR